MEITTLKRIVQFTMTAKRFFACEDEVECERLGDSLAAIMLPEPLKDAILDALARPPV